ncbi:arginine deiminase family protein [Legionella sainthelensi]|uniref:Methyltransferase small domain-containing protein n=1 Tax=Legionella sainthelensi TaxID=28087 RepID=A0A2H5FRM8_9GAMM|nr:arginine deiminase family protein [Legionella sainthelensi]AUH74201.1 methyltransferase domain-containing protein [Legionella sainthelensi]
MKQPNPIILVSEACCSISCQHYQTDDCTFKIDWTINPYMQISSTCPEKTKKQHFKFVNLLRNCGAHVLHVPFIHGAYDSVFIKDSVILINEPYGSRALITHSAFAERKVEFELRGLHLERLGVRIEGYACYHLEGGDVVVFNNEKVFMGFGFRTEREAANELGHFFKMPIIPLELKDPYFFHLDMALSILDECTVFAYKDAFTHASWETLCKSVRSLIPVSREEALRFGLNWVEVNNSIILGSYLPRIWEILTKMGKKVYHTALDQFQLAGGSAACLATQIYNINKNSKGSMNYNRIEVCMGNEDTLVTKILNIGCYLKTKGYQFTAVTPETHHRVLERIINLNELSEKEILRQFFGWNRALPKEYLPSYTLKLLNDANLLIHESGKIRSRVRFATLNGKLFAHSSFPTIDESSIFFGPDSYRFVNFLHRLNLPTQKILDIGCGSGVGALSLEGGVKILCDINQEAFRFARVNARLNECENVAFYYSDILSEAPSGADLLISNPPFMMDPHNRTYCNGGDYYGAEIALKIVMQAIEYLQPGASLALYTGSCIINGEDNFFRLCEKRIPTKKFHLFYEEIDPDIFGEELSQIHYKNVERIAAIGMVLTHK